MGWLTGIKDLRIRLSDGPTDRYNYQKRVFGAVNGTNATFKTFDFRRVTDFRAQAGVFINGITQGTTLIIRDDVLNGIFTLDPSIIPVDGDIVEASYYSQWFLDAEIDDFLIQSARYLLSSDQYQNIAIGLVPCAIEFAAGLAYNKMAERWSTMVSSGYKVEDAPDPNSKGPMAGFTKLAEDCFTKAEALLKRYYTRQGQNLQPLIGVQVGHVRAMP